MGIIAFTYEELDVDQASISCNKTMNMFYLCTSTLYKEIKRQIQNKNLCDTKLK